MNLQTISMACAKWFADKLLAPIILIVLAFVFGNFFLSLTIHRNHEEKQSLVVVDRFYETSLINLAVMDTEYSLMVSDVEYEPPDSIFEAQRARFRSLHVDLSLLEDAKIFPRGTALSSTANNPASRIVEMFEEFDPLVEGSIPRVPLITDAVENPSQAGTSRVRGNLADLIERRIRSCHQVMRYMIFARNVGPTRLHRWLAQATAGVRLRRPIEYEEICYEDP